MNAFYFIIGSCLLLGIVEVVKRKFSLSANITRKISHIGATIIAALSPLFIDKTIIVVTCLMFSLVLLFCRKMSFLSSIYGVNRDSLGDVFLPLGEALAAIIFLPDHLTAFQYGVLVMGICDALASLVGEPYGWHKVSFLGIKKSLEGSIVFFLSALLLAIFLFPILGFQIIIVAAILTLAEFFGYYGSDNLILPILGGFLFIWLV
ncbi:MAG: hypothetical protein WCT02_04265 [Candidatus Paceibacterota bacterium]